MTTDKRILILMSSYNGEKYIETQIKSIMEQTIISQVTLRIRDDGSTDKTCEVIEKLSKKYEGKIELIKGENLGYNASFFELLNGATGYEYYSLSDQDDMWLPSKLETALDGLNKEDNNIPLLYASTSYLVGDDLNPYGQTRRKQREFSIYNTAIQNICPGHTQVFNHALLEIIQDTHLDFDRIYVYDSWITSHAMLYGKILFNNSSYTYYRQHRGNQLGSGSGKIGQLIESIRRKDSGDGHRYRKQIEYFVEKNQHKLKKIGAYEEFQQFLTNKTVMDKIRYALCSKLYRQSKLETIVFHIGVISGNY